MIKWLQIFERKKVQPFLVYRWCYNSCYSHFFLANVSAAQTKCLHRAVFHIPPHTVLIGHVHTHLFNLHFNAAVQLTTRLGANGNEQLTDSLVDPHPVSLLVLSATEEYQKDSSSHISQLTLPFFLLSSQPPYTHSLCESSWETCMLFFTCLAQKWSYWSQISWPASYSVIRCKAALNGLKVRSSPTLNHQTDLIMCSVRYFFTTAISFRQDVLKST